MTPEPDLTLSREDLYELVWSKPMVELAQDLGLSDVALAKRCCKSHFMPARPTTPAPTQVIARSIVILRGQKVLLDTDLAALYGVTTKALNQAVKRNVVRFPADFIFRLTERETGALNRSPNVTGADKHRNIRFPPMGVAGIEFGSRPSPDPT